jgi:5-formyltetrahydrofolate cyclo-ligase
MEERGEVETGAIFKRIWNDHPEVKTFAPRVNSTTGEIDALPFREDSPLTLSKWGIPEPSDGEPAQPEEMDIVLVPLLCFDAGGHRVGYGKGYYDRFLAKCRPGCVKLGLSFFPPVDKIDDTFAGDVRLDRFITPDGVFVPK